MKITTTNLDEALQILQLLPSEFDNSLRLLACAFARTLPPDAQAEAVLRVAERHARDEAFNDELAAARYAAKESGGAAVRAAVAAAGSDAAAAAQDAAFAAAWWSAQATALEAESSDAAWWSAWYATRAAQAKILEAWLAQHGLPTFNRP